MKHAHGRTALVLGYGQIGSAVARELAEHGWQVRVLRHSARVPAPGHAGAIRFEHCDRNDAGALRALIEGGADAVIDTIAYTAEHGRQWLELDADIGSLTVISSVSVYCDGAGRTMDQAQGRGFPDFPALISEDQPTVAPGSESYPARKAALEAVLREQARCPVAILRPGAIHGENSRQPREWWFIKRFLDGRRRVPLAYGGNPKFHTSAAANIAALCRLTSERRANQTLNIVDPAALSAAQIGQAIASVYGVELDVVPLAAAPLGNVGQHPWCIPADMIMDMGRAERLGYRPVLAYDDTIEAVCRSAEAMAASGMPLPAYLGPEFFDYAAEDAFLGTVSVRASR
jgi:nucleoside-diphosphate-sugar epimerase